MEAPVAAFLFRLNQTHFFQRAQILFHPLNLCFGHATALQVNRKSSQVRGCRLATFRSGVAIMAAKFLLDQHGSYR